MATRPISNIRLVKSLHGGGAEMSGPEGATQTFLVGAPLAWASGYLQEAGSDPTAIVGIAAEPGHNAAASGDNRIAYWPLTGNVFEANLAQAASNTTSATTSIGTLYGIVKRSSGTVHWVVDSSDTTNTRCVIVDFAAPSVATDVNARVLIHFLQANDALTA